MGFTGLVVKMIVIGIAAFAVSGFSFTTKEKVVDLGPLEINKDKKHNVNWPPVAGYRAGPGWNGAAAFGSEIDPRHSKK
jgi:hypothetical protein